MTTPKSPLVPTQPQANSIVNSLQSPRTTFSSDTGLLQQRQVAQAHTRTTTTSARVIQDKNNSVELERDYHTFRSNLVDGLKVAKILLKEPAQIPSLVKKTGAIDLGEEEPRNLFTRRTLRDIADTGGVGVILSAPAVVPLTLTAKLNELASSKNENDAQRIGAKIVEKTANNALKDPYKKAIVFAANRIPLNSGLRKAINAFLPFAGDHISGVLAAAEEYERTGNIAEAVVVGRNYALISKASGTELAAICRPLAGAAAGALAIETGPGAVIAAERASLVAGYTCDAIGSAIAAEAYLAAIKEGKRYSANYLEEVRVERLQALSVAEQKRKAETAARVQATWQQAQADRALLYASLRRTDTSGHRLPAVVIGGQTQIARDTRTKIDMKLDGRRSVAAQANQVSADATDITRRNVTTSAEVYSYPGTHTPIESIQVRPTTDVSPSSEGFDQANPFIIE